RSTIVTIDGVEQAAPAPRFSRTPPAPPRPPDPGATDAAAALRAWAP
ncbi:CoA transferase, partial [Frankia sp. Ag45/Mut15]|nr:CoA transferase [Frankia umida]